MKTFHQVSSRSVLISSVLDLPGGMDIVVIDPAMAHHTFQVKGDFTVFQVKELVRTKLNPPDDFGLWFNRNEIFDTDVLSECGIVPNSRLSMVLKVNGITIIIVNAGESISLVVQRTATVRDVKMQAKATKGMDITTHGIIFSQTPLNDADRLCDKEVGNGATLLATMVAHAGL